MLAAYSLRTLHLHLLRQTVATLLVTVAVFTFILLLGNVLKDVLDLLASGLSDREIARALVVSEETARTYTKRLLQTLDVNNRLQAVLKGMRCGMVQL